MVTCGIVINTLLSYGCEKFIVTQLTKLSDRRLARKKKRNFSREMENLAIESRDRINSEPFREDEDNQQYGAAVAEREGLT